MAETKREFTKYDDWNAAGKALGLDGPFRVGGQLTLWQFVGDQGTQGMWNALGNSGFLFEPSQATSKGDA
jgi:hypothetical protein